MNKNNVARVLTIAGSDSSGGAGIEADLKTFTALGAYGMVAVTSITAQNTAEVLSVYDLPAEIIKDQIDAVAKDIGIDAAKTGMLSNEAIIDAVVRSIKKHQITKLIVDPVMVAKSKALLLQPSAIEFFKDQLIPLAYIITPNIPEAETLTGVSIRNKDDIKFALRQLKDLGPKYVLLKGGHFQSETATDWLFDGTDIIEFTRPRINSHNTHGTGCTLSAAIAAFIAKGNSVIEAIQAAKNYLTVAIRHGFSIGKGHGPLNHFWVLDKLEEC